MQTPLRTLQYAAILFHLPSLSFSNDDLIHYDDDYVPRFFGGRRNEDDDSGMGPPRPHLKMRSTPVTEFVFTQKLDHFNKENNRSWNQRYIINNQYFDPMSRKAPKIFLRIGGESSIDPSDLVFGPWVRMARKHSGLLVELEHRFYGQSRPTADVSIRNLRYLSSRQAIEDLDSFIIMLKHKYRKCKEPRVVLYGCSYAGFSSHIFYILRKFNGCNSAVEKTFRTFVMNETGQSIDKPDVKLRNHLKLCDIKKDKDMEMFSLLYDVTARLMREVQYDQKVAGSESNIERLCKALRRAEPYGTTPPIQYTEDGSQFQDYDHTISYEMVEEFGNWLQTIDRSCVINDGRHIRTLNTRWEHKYTEAGTRQWMYQMCSEFGFFITLMFQSSEFGIDEMYLKPTCKHSFNITDIEQNVDRTNQMYGGLDINATHIYFLNGKMDPWIVTSFEEAGKVYVNGTALENVTVRIVDDMSHCQEPEDREDESKELVEAWVDIDKKISEWIND